MNQNPHVKEIERQSLEAELERESNGVFSEVYEFEHLNPFRTNFDTPFAVNETFGRRLLQDDPNPPTNDPPKTD